MLRWCGRGDHAVCGEMLLLAALLTHYALLVSLISSPMSLSTLVVRSYSPLLVGWSSSAAPGVGLLLVSSLLL